MDDGNFATAQAPIQASSQESPDATRNQRLTMVGVVIGVVVLLAALVAFIVYLASPGTPTDKIRDIFIIFMALEFLLLGLALGILIVQLATLINLLQNEVKPLLDSTNETANTLRGTAIFLSDNLVDPVIKLNEYLAALRRMMGLINIARK